MTNYLFVSNSSNYKIDNNIINQINSILNDANVQFTNKEIKKNNFYEWFLKENKFKDIIKEKIENFSLNLPIDVNFLKIMSPRKKKTFNL